jgi:hypothetical protein
MARIRSVPLSGAVRDIVIAADGEELVLTILPADRKVPIIETRLTADERTALVAALKGPTIMRPQKPPKITPSEP